MSIANNCAAAKISKMIIANNYAAAKIFKLTQTEYTRNESILTVKYMYECSYTLSNTKFQIRCTVKAKPYMTICIYDKLCKTSQSADIVQISFTHFVIRFDKFLQKNMTIKSDS